MTLPNHQWVSELGSLLYESVLLDLQYRCDNGLTVMTENIEIA